ncbi:MAG: hypothetical protein H7A33_07070 [Deltaproteobacteria bacterium]|nr:hypothetical protein [Deltaproteobacteria bacterium]
MAEELDTGSLSKAQKAALIFLLLEEKGAASLFDHMTDDEIKSIGSTLLSMEEIPVSEMSQILSEFYSDLGVGQKDQFSGKKIFEKLVSKTLPNDRTGKILNVSDVKGGRGSADNPLEPLLKEMSGEQLFKLIKTEHPQTIAVILTLVKPGQAKAAINQFEDEQKTDILYRMSVLSKIPGDMIEIISENFKAKLAEGGTEEEEADETAGTEVPGTDLVLRYLKTQDWAQAEGMISKIESENPEVAAKLRKKFFTLEDMLRADNNGIRNLLKSIETATLSVALKSESEEVQDKFFQNMSTRAAAILKEDMEVMPEQKEEDVEAAQSLILEEAKKLIGEGQMILEPIGEG